MKTPLLLIGFLWLNQSVNAQIGLHSIYNPSPLLSSKKNNQQKKTRTFAEIRQDTMFIKGQPIFSQYIPRPKNYRSLILVGNSMALMNPNGINEIDLDRTRNRAKLLFFKMKMWRYFR